MIVEIPVRYADSDRIEYVRLSVDDRGLLTIALPKGRDTVKLQPDKLHRAVERLLGREVPKLSTT